MVNLSNGRVTRHRYSITASFTTVHTAPARGKLDEVFVVHKCPKTFRVSVLGLTRLFPYHFLKAIQIVTYPTDASLTNHTVQSVATAIQIDDNKNAEMNRKRITFLQPRRGDCFISPNSPATCALFVAPRLL